MNFLLVRNAYLNKGYMSDYNQLNRSLNNLGHKSILVGLGDKYKFAKEFVLLKLPFKRRSIFLIELFFFIPIYCILKKIDVVVVDDRVIIGTFLLLMIKKLLKIKIILDIRSIPVESDLQFDYRFSCQIANKFYDGTTFITEGTKEYIEQIIQKTFPKYIIFPSGVNPTIFTPNQINCIPINIKNKIKDRIVIFYHGSISPNRGINLILDAIDKIKEVYPNIIFMSISEANYYIENYCKSKQYDLKNNLSLIDAVNHDLIAAYIDLADLCIIPLPRILWWEISSPLKLMEYLAMEKPIILSDITAHLSVVPQDSKFAVFFNPDDPDDLEIKMKQAINNIDLLKNNSFQGRKIILNKYTWDIQAKLVAEFVKNL
jgi:glycosyltransferase involved in cell wall biosynthesis